MIGFKKAVLVFLGCGTGGLLRYWVSHLSDSYLGHHFPYGTLIANVSGCFLMGLMSAVILERFGGSELLKLLLLTGLLGGYTTFSSFSIETLRLFQAGHYWGAVANIFLSLLLCLIGVWLGVQKKIFF